MLNCDESFTHCQRELLTDACDIFSSAFSTPIVEEELYNKHFLNPFRIDDPIRIRYENDVPAGMTAFMGMYIINNEDGKTHYVAQANDTAVVPAARGKGIFVGIVDEFEKNDRECEYCFCIPNENSYRGYLKIGWKKTAELRTLSMIRSKLSLLKQPRALKTGIIKTGNKTYRLLTKAAFSEEELNKINKSSNVIVYRTNQYINWKISNQRGYLYLCYINEILQGYLIFHLLRRKKHGISYNQVVIDDWYYCDNSALRDLVSRVCCFGYSVYVTVINRINREYNDFLKCGFCDHQDNNSDYIFVSPRGQNDDYLNRLSFRGIDGDYILNSQ